MRIRCASPRTLTLTAMDPGVLTGMDPPHAACVDRFDFRPAPDEATVLRTVSAAVGWPGLLGIQFVGVRRRTRFAQIFPGRRGRPWRCGGVRPAARRSGRVRKSGIRRTAVHWRVNVCDGDAGNRPSGRTMPTTARTRRGRSARGFNAIAIIGARIGARIPSTARAIALRRDSGNASVGGARRSLQRWTRQRRFRTCLPGLIGWCRRVPQSLQRWTRGSWK